MKSCTYYNFIEYWYHDQIIDASFSSIDTFPFPKFSFLLKQMINAFYVYMRRCMVLLFLSIFAQSGPLFKFLTISSCFFSSQVYTYCRSLPMPITSYKFGSIDPLSGHDIAEDNGQFVSSVCWRGKSNMVVAANSSGTIKLLQMVWQKASSLVIHPRSQSSYSSIVSLQLANPKDLSYAVFR